MEELASVIGVDVYGNLGIYDFGTTDANDTKWDWSQKNGYWNTLFNDVEPEIQIRPADNQKEIDIDTANVVEHDGKTEYLQI